MIYYKGSNYPTFKGKVFDYLDNVDNKIKSEDKHQYAESHMLGKINRISRNNNLDTLELIFDDSVMYVLNVNMKRQ